MRSCRLSHTDSARTGTIERTRRVSPRIQCELKTRAARVLTVVRSAIEFRSHCLLSPSIPCAYISAAKSRIKMGKKRKFEVEKKDENEFGLPAKFLSTSHIRSREKRLIIVLEGAQLETVKVSGAGAISWWRFWLRFSFTIRLQVGNTFELLNCDDHINIMRRNHKDPAGCRPDITHQSLLMLFDSPLNRAGLLQVYIHTAKNVLIEVNPQTRIPRTFKRFGGLMGECGWHIDSSCDVSYIYDLAFSVQLLHKMSVRAADTTMKLMKVIKNPITDHLPVGCKKYVMSFTGTLAESPRDLVPKEDDEPITLVIGAFAHGNVDVDYTEGAFSISKYPLSAALACSKLCNAFEEVWGINWITETTMLVNNEFFIFCVIRVLSPI